MVDAQQYLDQNYPKEQRNSMEELRLGYENLTGELLLTNWANLELITLHENQITSLTIINCPQIKRIQVRSNRLTKLKGLSVSLISLNLRDNQLSGNLEIFSQLVNLEELNIGNLEEEGINQGIYNRWTGSLQPLQNLTKLKWLSIDNTDINSGAEYLPVSIRDLFYGTSLRPNCQLTKIVDKLEQFKKIEGKDAREEWKREQQSKSIQYTSQIEWH